MRALTKVKPGYKNFYLYSAINPETGEEFTLFLPTVNTEMMNLYLSHLRETYPGKRMILVMDQAGWHKAKELKVPEGIELEYLPPYSPELNPVERLWQWIRRHFCRNRMFDSLDQLENALVSEWHLLTQSIL